MTDNDQSPDGSTKPDTQNQDPFLELTQLFDLDSNNLDYSSLNQTIAPNADSQAAVGESENSDLDLSFMDDETTNNTANVAENTYLDAHSELLENQPSASPQNFSNEDEHSANNPQANIDSTNIAQKKPNITQSDLLKNIEADMPSFLQQEDYGAELEGLLSPEPISPFKPSFEPKPYGADNNFDMLAMNEYSGNNNLGEADLLPLENAAAINPWQSEHNFKNQLPSNTTLTNEPIYPEKTQYNNTGYDETNAYSYAEEKINPIDNLQNNFAPTEDYSAPQDDNAYADPFGLEDLSEDDHIISNEPLPEEIVVEEEQQETSNEEGSSAPEYVYEPAEETDDVNHQGEYPPDVDTYKFADEIVETTETIDVPDVPYQEQESKPTIDPIKGDFNDIFNIGNSEPLVPEVTDEESFYYNGFQKPRNEQTSHAEQLYNDDEYFFDPQEAELPGYNNYDEEQYQKGYEENTYDFIDEQITNDAALGAATADHSVYEEERSSFVKKAAIATGGLVVVLGVTYGASQYFFSAPDNTPPAIIQADDTPFKVPAKVSETQNNRPDGEDVYDIASGSETVPQPKQDVLIDRSETPEDLTSINEQAPKNNGAYVQSTAVENAISAATNQAVPIREVQTVIVNPDGTIVPGPTQIITPKQQAQQPHPQPTTKPPTAVASQTTPQTSTVAQSSNSFDIASIINSDNSIYEDINMPTTNNQQQAPAQQQQTSSPPASIATSAPAARPTAPTMPVTANTYYVQLSAHQSEDLAQNALNQSRSRLGSLINNLPLSIQGANIPGKGTYYRVRIQTSSRDNAVNLCDSIKNSGGSCFVSR